MKKPFNRLIPEADLIAANERYEAEQFAERQRKLAEIQADHAQKDAERAAIPEKKPFVYRARTPEQWESRMKLAKTRQARRKPAAKVCANCSHPKDSHHPPGTLRYRPNAEPYVTKTGFCSVLIEWGTVGLLESCKCTKYVPFRGLR